MINKYEILKKIAATGIVAIVRADDEIQAEKIAASCIKGGINIIEVTYTTGNANQAITALSKKYAKQEQDVVIGAGTVLDSETARAAILAGAKFIVGPNFNLEVCKLCNRYQIPYTPGCMTINEIITALEAGADVIKIFPANALGIDYVKTIKGPLPQLTFIPTGGVSLDNIEQWFKIDCFAVGVGGKLVSGAKTGNYDLITETAEKFIEKIKHARGN